MMTGSTARIGVAGFLVAVMLGGSVVAGPLEEGQAAYERGDYTAALRAWIPLAERGDSVAQYNLGAMFHSGKGLRCDYPEAVKWYRRSAQNGNAEAQTRLAVMYHQGLGLTQNADEAFTWYRKAAEHGHLFAQYNVGRMYQRGQGARQDFVQAYKWFDLVATSSEPGYLRSDAAQRRDRLAGRMTTEEVEEARNLAREWPHKN